MVNNLWRRSSLAFVASSLLATVSQAFIYVPVPDERLVDSSELIVVGTVKWAIDGPDLDWPTTQYLIQIDRLLKGSPAGSALLVELPGGNGRDGIRYEVDTSPSFETGEQALLFLTPTADGNWTIRHGVLGAFRADRSAPQRRLERALLGGPVENRSSQDSAHLRDLDKFSNWIEDRARGEVRSPDYFLPTEVRDGNSLTPFRPFVAPSGLNFRWFEFDSGGQVAWRNFEAFPVPGGGSNEFSAALAAWNNETQTPIRLTYAGVAASPPMIACGDGVNSIAADDFRNEVDGNLCPSLEGILAYTGTCYHPNQVRTFNGRSFHPIFEASMVFNNGFSTCWLPTQSSPSIALARVIAHELGHSLGLDHSSVNPNESNQTLRQALMYFLIEESTVGRGARLESDDISWIRYLYARSGGGGGGGGGATGGCPAGTPANTLCLLNRRFHVTGTWRNQFDGSSGTAVPITNTNLSGFFYFTDPSNVELILKVLDFGTEIKVFYSQLTNLQFTLTVTDTASGRTKTYSNTPGDCGAIDPNFELASSSVGGRAGNELGLLAAGFCSPSNATLCLLNRRFAVNVVWRNQFNGVSGVGISKPLSGLTGAFSFDDPANLELLIKTLDFGDHVLVLYGSLSNFEYIIRVTDTLSGRYKDYHNAAGNYCGGLDTNAF